MKAPQEIKGWINRLRRCGGKKNGVVPSYMLDAPDQERKMATNKRINNRAKPRDKDA